MYEKFEHCDHCKSQQKVWRKSPNHVLHLLLSIFTVGFWLPIWLLSCVSIGGWKCSHCGNSPRTLRGSARDLALTGWALAKLSAAAVLTLAVGIFVWFVFIAPRPAANEPGQPVEQVVNHFPAD